MTSTGPDVKAFNPGWRLLAAFASISIVNLACALDATTISVALPTISNDLHGDSIEAFWTGTSFLLASAVWQPNFVAFSHIFGRKPLFIIALVLFTIGTIISGVSRNFTLMLLGRCVQGSGVGGILTLTEALMTDLIPLRHRGNFFALLSIVWAIGTLAGPLVGGILAQVGAWRWIFWLNLPILAIGLGGVMVFLKLEQRVNSLHKRVSEIDYIGSFLFVASATAFLVPISWGGVMFSWSSWHTLVPMLLGVAGLAAFCIYEIFLAKSTLLPLAMFRTWSTSIAYFMTFVHGIILWSIVYYLPLYFMAVEGYTPIIAGVGALPQSTTVVPCAAIVGLVAAKTGKYRWSLWAGWMLTVLGVGLLYILGVGTKVVAWIFLLVVSGIGIGVLFPAMNLAIQASVPPKDIAIGAGLFTFFRALGQTFGVAIGGIIFQNRMASELKDYPDSAQYSTDAVSLIQAMRHLPDGSAQKIILKTAFANSIKTIWVVMCGLAAIGLIASCFVKEYDLNQALATEQGFVQATKNQAGTDSEDVEMSVSAKEAHPIGSGISRVLSKRDVFQ